MFIKSIVRMVKNFHYKSKFIYKHILFHENSQINKLCNFEGFNAVGINTMLSNCSIGLGSYVGMNNELSSIKIGKFCSIGSFITNTTGNHPSSIFVSTHPAFFSKGKAAGFTFTNETKFDELHYVEDNYLVSIGNDVWIGDHVTLLDGIKIGDGAIIGTGSVVTKDIEPYSINVGVPAKTIRKRFTDEEIEFLLNFKWWDKDWEWIKENAQDFDDIIKIIEKNEN